jgi:hypothetical protein
MKLSCTRCRWKAKIGTAPVKGISLAEYRRRPKKRQGYRSSWCQRCLKEARKILNAQSRATGGHDYRSLRRKVLALFGNKCNWPGCKWVDPRALQLDHLNGKGNRERTKLGGIVPVYRRALRLKGKGYQVLCANHNWVKRVERREVTETFRWKRHLRRCKANWT